MQLEFFDVPSPCIGVCQSDDKGYCKGCFRTRDERQNWITLNIEDKQKVVKRCQQRKKRKLAPAKLKEQSNEELDVQTLQPSLLDPPSNNTLDTSTDFDFDDFEL